MSAFNRYHRVRLFVDPEVQPAILIRFLIYTAAAFGYFLLMFLSSQWMQDPLQSFDALLLRVGEDMLYWLPGFFILIPLALNDLLKTSARFVGPILRLQAEMKLLLQCKSERPIRFRDGDYWNDLASTYNQVRGEVLMLRKQVIEYENILAQHEITAATSSEPPASDSEAAAAADPPPAATAADEATAEDEATESAGETTAEMQQEPADDAESEDAASSVTAMNVTALEESLAGAVR